MKYTCPLMALLLSLATMQAMAQSTIEARKSVGSVYSRPVEVGTKLYFVASTGVLYESDRKMENVKRLFQTRKQTVSGVAHSDGILYFGEGLHADKTTTFYGFELKTGKTKFRVFLDGHMEKTPLISGGTVFVPAGQAGLVALDAKTGELKWRKQKLGQKAIHVDSSPILIGSNICAASIYETKAVFCVEPKEGKDVWSTPLDRSPKTDLVVAGDKIVALTTEGNLMKTEEREEPTEFTVLNSSDGKIIATKKTRGFNLFPQIVNEGQMFLALSTGDVIRLSIKDGEMTILDQIAEPLSSSTFSFDDLECAVSSLGRILCYRDKRRVVDMNEKEVVIGNVGSAIDGAYFLPTRIGYKRLEVQALKAAAANAPKAKVPAGGQTPSGR